jgi:hypothetical protein
MMLVSGKEVLLYIGQRVSTLVMCRIIIHAENILASNSYNIYNTCISCLGYYHVDIYDKADLILQCLSLSVTSAGGQ